METKDMTILVTGATGRQGGAVARHLRAEGFRVRALTRHPEQAPARILKELGCEVVQGDLSDAASVQDALQGVYGVFSVQQPWEHGVDVEIEQGMMLADLARRASARHFIYSSIGSANRKTGIPHFDSKAKIEEHVKQSGLHYTIFRPVYYMDNLAEPTIRKMIMQGRLPLALNSDIPLQMIAVDDIGALVAMAFKDPERFMGKEFDLAGDEITGPQMAEILSRHLGRQVVFEELEIAKLNERSAEQAMMFDWFNLRGDEADIESLRQIYPDLKSFEDWVRPESYRAAA